MLTSSALNLKPTLHLMALITLLSFSLLACSGDDDSPPPTGGDAAADAGDAHLSDGRDTETIEPMTCPVTPCLAVGQFWVGWDQEGDGTLSIRHANQMSRVLWQTSVDTPLVTSDISAVNITDSRGSFTVDVERTTRCEGSAIETMELQGEDVVVSGSFADCALTFTMTLKALSERRLQFELVSESGDDGPPYNITTLGWASSADEAFFGFGAQYSVLNMKGRLLPIWCQEQGHGRGLEPITEVLNQLSPGSGGDWYTSYTAVPYMLSTQGYGLVLDHNEYLEFDMRQDDAVRASVFAPRVKGQLLYGANPQEIVETYTEYSGRMSPLPDWSQQGAIVRSYGGAEVAQARVDELNEVDGALAALWIEDWVGTRETPFGTRMWWNWTVDRTIYPEFEEMVASLSAQGVRSLIYFNPFLVDASDKPGVERVLYQEAIDGGYLMKDPEGEVIVIDNGGFSAGMVDLTNPEAQQWIKDLMFEMIDAGVAGWMADFGEALPLEIHPHSGADPAAYHNQYPYDWAELNRAMAEEAEVTAGHLTFNRSGNAKSPSVARSFWIGDQLVTWDEYDGLRTVIPALLSSGLSGYSLQHSDVGGWLSVDQSAFGLTYYRSKELFQRWLETCTFTILLRLHTTNLPEKNHQYDSDEETLVHFAKMTRIFKALAPYRKTLMDEAASRGLPIVRHMMLHYPDDEAVYALEQQFMLGGDFLIAPVVDEGATKVSLYLPKGTWVHLWSGDSHGSEDAGTTLEIDAPIGEPAVFYRSDSTWGPELREAIGLTD